MNKITRRILIAATAALSLASVKIGLCEPNHRGPNIVFILADDLGWADVGCNGSKFYVPTSFIAGFHFARGCAFS